MTPKLNGANMSRGPRSVEGNRTVEGGSHLPAGLAGPRTVTAVPQRPPFPATRRAGESRCRQSSRRLASGSHTYRLPLCSLGPPAGCSR